MNNLNNFRKTNQKDKREGYTMIEILVVISIIGFMLSAAMYLLTSSRENARIARAKEFASIVNGKLGSSLIGWWALDEGSGNNANDGWAKNNGCQRLGSPAWVDGILGKALYFNVAGGADYYSVPHNCSTQGSFSPPITSSDITITAWFKTISVGTILALGRSSGGTCLTEFGGFGLENTAGSDQGKVVAPDSSSEVRGNKDYRDDKWHFVAVKMGSGGVQIWVDGALDGSSLTNTVTVTNNTYMLIGVGTGCHWGAFTGTIDDVKLYNESLTAQEIQKYYAEGAPKHELAVK